MAFNYSALLGKIREVYGTQEKFAKALNISPRTLSLKLNNRIDFKQPEITKACDLLSISADEIPKYFFSVVVQ